MTDFQWIWFGCYFLMLMVIVRDYFKPGSETHIFQTMGYTLWVVLVYIFGAVLLGL